MRFRIEQTVLACGLSAVGLAIGTLRLLKNPASGLSRMVDHHAAPVMRVQVDGTALRALVRAEAQRLLDEQARAARRSQR